MNLQPVTVLFPAFLRGGAEGVCAWALQTLRNQFDTTLFTLSGVDFGSLNEQFGTNLLEGDIRVIRPSIPALFDRALLRRPSAFSLRQQALSYCYRKSHNLPGLPLCMFNELDMGRTGLQYVHGPIFGPVAESTRALLGYSNSLASRCGRKACQVITRFSTASVRQNLTLVNSEWTARHLDPDSAAKARVVYPPIVLSKGETPWAIREDGFVLISRVVPEKRIELAIEILSWLREAGHKIHLHIVFSGGDDRYRHDLQEKSRGLDWILWENRITRTKLSRLLSKHRYAIHVRENEQFGMGVAEAMTAGCVPFVARGGGPKEIIGNNPNLFFKDPKEACQKISAVLNNRDLQYKLSQELHKRRALFSLETFQAGILNGVSNLAALHHS